MYKILASTRPEFSFNSRVRISRQYHRIASGRRHTLRTGVLGSTAHAVDRLIHCTSCLLDQNSGTPSPKTPNVTKMNLTKNLPIRLLEKYAPPLVPYGYLSRIDKPIGTTLLLHPCLISLTMNSPTFLPDPYLLFLFGVGGFAMRGAGCTINDMWDRDIDGKVERTKTRPMASGEINFSGATVHLAAQLGVGLAVLTSLPHTEECFKLGVMSLPLVFLYPTAKRWTRYPQFVLGATFNWGVFMGCAAETGAVNYDVCLPMYAGLISWTIVYDTIYAMMDKEDDKKVGINSTALTFGDNFRPILTGFSAVFVAGLSTAGYMSGISSSAYFCGIFGCGSHLLWQVWTADSSVEGNCLERFKSNDYVGLGVLASVLAGGALA